MQAQNTRISEWVLPTKVGTQAMVYSNMVYLSPDSPLAVLPRNDRFLIFKGYILSFDLSVDIPKGKIGLGNKFREFLNADLVHQIQILAYYRADNDYATASIDLRVEFFIPPKERVEVDDISLTESFIKEFNGRYIATDQAFTFEYKKTPYVLTVQKIVQNEAGNPFLGIQTKFVCSTGGKQSIRLKSAKQKQKVIFSEDFTLESLGIGGLNNQLTDIFRRAFALRRLPLSVIDKFGIKHVKGILLYGPPGTGKTLIARQLAKSLKVKSLQIVNGPEVFSKYVGQSAQNVRKLFQPAREDEKKQGDQSPLHMIVFDEIDAICRQRGTDSGGTTAKDDVVNQILTNLDGVQALNNIVVIGMTNRKDLIDEAVLRPGRLEVHIQIGLPDENGRKQILQVHTKQLKQQKLLAKDVDLDQIAKITKNYTGAELEAVVKNASSFAMLKGNDVMDFSKAMKLTKDTKVTRSDFMKAIDEILPGFGVDQEQFQILSRNPLQDYGKRYQMIWDILGRSINLALKGQSQVASVLLHGETGTGKTSIAAEFAVKSNFSYVKLISPEKFIGVGSQGKISGMTKIFNDAYKSNSSLIVIDNIDRLVEFVDGVNDFNNYVLQSLLTLVEKLPTNPNCRLLIIGTSSNYSAMQLLDVDKSFNIKVKVPLLNEKECEKILRANIGIKNQPIKKVIQFKESVQDGSPPSEWRLRWEAYS